MTMQDRDALLRLAIAPPADIVAPADLADAIFTEVLATPQRRGFGRFARLNPLARLEWLPSPTAVALALLALVALAVLAVALASRARPILSTYHGGPDRTGVMPGPGPIGEPVALWDVARPGPIQFTSMPIPAGDRVLVGDASGWLAALAVLTGDTIWELDVGSAIHGAPTTAGDRVVVGTEAGEVVAVDIASSQIVWRRQLEAGAVTATLLAVGDVVYAGTDGGRLFALAAADGSVRWSVDVLAAVSRGPSSAGGVVYVPTHDGRLWAVDTATHATRWSVALAPGDVGTPSVVGNRIYVGRGLHGDGSVHGDLVALDTADGHVVWAFASPTGEQVHAGAIADGRIYPTAEDGTLHALDANTGRQIWTAEIGGKLATLAVLAGDVLYVTSTDRTVSAVDPATGRQLWQVHVTGDPTMAAVVGGRLYIGTNLGRVVALGDGPASQ